jgi:TFIIF-interacting CTD phosphatase-like protein
MRNDITVVLDLDNTLIYSIPMIKGFPKKFTKKKSYLNQMNTHKMNDDFIVFERPGLQKFLSWLFKNFNVIVWSAASPDYVEFIVKNIIEKKNRKVEYVLNSENCQDSQRIFGDKHIKNLKLLWDVHDLPLGPHTTLIIDDLKMVKGIQPHNALQIKSFNTNKITCIDDCELDHIKKSLINIKKHFKNIEKPNFKLVPSHI